MLPGPLRHPLGLTRPLLRPADYQGAVIGARRSVVAQRAFEQLGATTDTHYVDSVDGLDGVESDLAGIEAGRWDLGAVSLAADLALWPRVLVLIANPKAWNALDESHRDALRAAARASLPTAIATLESGDDEGYAVLCRRSAGALVRATAADVRALRAALAPVSAHARPGHDARDRPAARTGRSGARPPAVPPTGPERRTMSGTR